MAISSDFHMGKHRDDDHEEDAPYFISVKRHNNSFLKNAFRQMQQIPMTSPPAVGYPTPDPQWLHRQQQISRMAQVHHAHQERAATPWAMNPYALNQSKF